MYFRNLVHLQKPTPSALLIIKMATLPFHNLAEVPALASA
jgi:hypothetical protein